MNERIEKLNRLALGEVLNGQDPDNDIDKMYIPAQFTKKFAELIVKECLNEIGMLRGKYDTHRDVEPAENDWYVDAFLQAEVKIKEYFGVEE